MHIPLSLAYLCSEEKCATVFAKEGRETVCPICGNTNNLSLDKVLNRLENWISVKDRLPTGEDIILVFSETHGIPKMGSFNPETDEWTDEEDGDGGLKDMHYDIEVSHWMPLPDDPK